MEETAARIVPNILSLAGVDPSGGAGLLADIKTISALGGYACGAVTALTVQNTRGVSGVRIMSGDFVSAQMESVLSDIRIDAVKIGMLGNCEVIEAAAGILRDHPVKHVVLDTILASTSGTPLLEPEAVGVLIRKPRFCLGMKPRRTKAAWRIRPADSGILRDAAQRSI